MGIIFKILNSLLGVVAVVICLAAVGIIVYSATQPNMGGSTPPTVALGTTAEEGQTPSPTAGEAATGSPGTETAVTASPGHVHEYVETIELQATCEEAGLKRFLCACGDFYFEDIPQTSHVAGDWMIVTAATETLSGLREQKCIYCGIVMASEVIPTLGSGTSGGAAGVHIHDYVASIERQPTCTVSGIRRYVCSCGSYYRENIHAIGHVVGEWSVVTAATTTGTGVMQRICNVCHTVIDSQVIPALPATPSPSTTPTASPGTTGNVPAGSPTPTPTVTPTPTATPHTHNYHYYVSLQPTCISEGISTGNCSCGVEDQKVIEPDPERHQFSITVVRPTATQGGYTRHRCILCGYTFNDNETPATG